MIIHFLKKCLTEVGYFLHCKKYRESHILDRFIHPNEDISPVHVLTKMHFFSKFLWDYKIDLSDNNLGWGMVTIALVDQEETIK